MTSRVFARKWLGLVGAVVVGVSPTVWAYTLDGLALDLAQYDDSIQYDFVECPPKRADAVVTLTEWKPETETVKESRWYFRRDTMSRRTYDSILTYQRLAKGSPGVYILDTCYQRTYVRNRLVHDSLANRGTSPHLFPRKSHRMRLYWGGGSIFEFCKDTTIVLPDGNGHRKLSATLLAR